ncbi:MAG: hypothetical protein JWM69_94 [Candidatus Binatus sp.]|nr:hypothetical protein [Candidatus Binatus sp.]
MEEAKGILLSLDDIRARLLGNRDETVMQRTALGQTVSSNLLTPARSAPPRTEPVKPAMPAAVTAAPVNPAPTKVPPGAEIIMSTNDQPRSNGAVAKVFEPTKVFQERFAKLIPAFEQVDRLGLEAISAFELIGKLGDHLAQIALAYGPVKEFHNQIEMIAKDFDPIKGVQSQLTELSESFRDQLSYLAASLEPAGKMQSRFAQLATAFEPAVALRRRFEELSRAFENLAAPAAAPHSATNGNGNHDVAQQRAI